MTTLGKILVIVNFVFTIVTGALILMVFTVSTNWKSSYDRLAKYYEVSQAIVKTYASEAQAIKTTSDTKIDELGKEVASLKGDYAKLKTERDALDKQIETQMALAKSAGVSTETATAEMLRLREELKQNKEQVVLRDKQLLEFVTKNKELLERSVRNEIAARASQERAKQLVTQLEDSYRELEKMKAGLNASTTPGGAIIRRPPPEDVEGVVMESDLRNGLITISIGSDAGITKGNTLEVYRLKPEPKYLGTLRILEVNHHQAVGRPQTNGKAALIQKGDIVASSIMGQR